MVESRVERMKGFGMDGSSNGLDMKKGKGRYLPPTPMMHYFGIMGTEVQYTHDSG